MKDRNRTAGAIVVAGIIIAIAIIFTNGSGSDSASREGNEISNPEVAQEQSTDNVAKITKDDHIKGSPNADVVIVEYSDFECPFCARFHSTMQQAIDEYGASGQVAWVYRHFPLDGLHAKARAEAVASECAAEQGGNDAFWAFTDRFFELTPSNDRTNLDVVIPQIVSEIGLDQTEFDACTSSGKYDQHIQDDIDNAVATGGQGTPWSVVIGADGTTYPLSGAQPYSAVKQLIEIALSST